MVRGEAVSNPTPHCEAVDPVVEAVAKYLHEMFHTSPYERWSCWINAEDVVNIVRQTTPTASRRWHRGQ